MSKTFVYERFNVRQDVNGEYDVSPRAEGDWIKAQDALDREAVNADRIRVLELQLKESRVKCKGLEQFLDNANETNKKLTLRVTTLNNLYNDAHHEVEVKTMQLHFKDVEIDNLQRIINNR